jgi:hypothetical protein
MNNHALADAPHIANRPPNRPLTKPIHPRRHRNRPPLTWHARNILNARTYDAQYSAPHRFDFRKLRHFPKRNKGEGGNR